MQKQQFFRIDAVGVAVSNKGLAAKSTQATSAALAPTSGIDLDREYRIVSWLLQKRRLLAGLGDPSW